MDTKSINTNNNMGSPPPSLKSNLILGLNQDTKIS